MMAAAAAAVTAAAGAPVTRAVTVIVTVTVTVHRRTRTVGGPLRPCSDSESWASESRPGAAGPERLQVN